MKTNYKLLLIALSTTLVSFNALANIPANSSYTVVCTGRTPNDLSSRYTNNLTISVSGKRDSNGFFLQPDSVDLKNNPVKDRFPDGDPDTNDKMIEPAFLDASSIKQSFVSDSGTLYVLAKIMNLTIEVQTYYYGVGPVNAGFLYATSEGLFKFQGRCELSLNSLIH